MISSTKFLTTRITRYYRLKGYEVQREVTLGNCVIDLIAINPRTKEKIAIEVKGSGDDLIRGIGQLAEALAWGYDQAILVMPLKETKMIALKVFKHFNIRLIGINSRGIITRIT